MITKATEKLFEAVVASTPFNNQLDVNFNVAAGKPPIVTTDKIKNGLLYGAEEGIQIKDGKVAPTIDKRTAAVAGGAFGKELRSSVAKYISDNVKTMSPKDAVTSFSTSSFQPFAGVAEDAGEVLAATALAKKAAEKPGVTMDSNLVKNYLKIPYVQDIGEAAKKAYNDKLPADYGVEQKSGEPTLKQKQVAQQIKNNLKNNIGDVVDNLKIFKENLSQNITNKNAIFRVQQKYNKMLASITGNGIITKNQQLELKQTLDSFFEDPDLLQKCLNIDIKAQS